MSICGELGGDALAAAALVGLGYRKLSMPPVHMGYVKQVICTGPLCGYAEAGAQPAGEADTKRSGSAAEQILRIGCAMTCRPKTGREKAYVYEIDDCLQPDGAARASGHGVCD